MNGKWIYEILSELFQESAQTDYSLLTRTMFSSILNLQLLGQNISFL